MPKRFSAHDLRDYANCPRSWWYERNNQLALMEREALLAHLDARKIILGRGAARDPDILLMERLLKREERFAAGKTRHVQDARHQRISGRSVGCLPAAAVLTTALILALCLALSWA